MKKLRHLHRGEKEQRRKGWIYLEKEYICSAEEKKNVEGKGWKYVWEGRCQDGIVKDKARILDSEFAREKKKKPKQKNNEKALCSWQPSLFTMAALGLRHIISFYQAVKRWNGRRRISLLDAKLRDRQAWRVFEEVEFSAKPASKIGRWTTLIRWASVRAEKRLECTL